MLSLFVINETHPEGAYGWNVYVVTKTGAPSPDPDLVHAFAICAAVV